MHSLPLIPDGSEVWFRTHTQWPIPGQVTTQASTPRSYIVDTQSGQLQGNSYHLNVIPENQCSPSTFETKKDNQSPPRHIMTRSRTDTLIGPEIL